MAEATEGIVHGKALEWGGSIGIRISRKEAKRLGIQPGQEIDLKILPADHRLDVSHFHTFSDGRGASDHDRLLGQARSSRLGRRTK